MWFYMLLMSSKCDFLYLWVPKCNHSPSNYQTDKPPGQQAGYEEENAPRHEQQKEERRGKRFVRKVNLGCDIGYNEVITSAEIVHAILQIAHVTEEVFAHLSRGTYGSRRGERRAAANGGGVQWGWRCWGMANEEGWDHDKEKYDCYWKNSKEIGIEADEGVNGKKRECMAGGSPSEQA